MSTLAQAILRGTHGDRPTDNSAGTEGRLYYETDTNKLFRDNGATWDDCEGAGGAGDVVGPGSSTDNAIARFDSTTGKLLQNGLATVDDSGGVNIPTGQTYNINGSPHTHAAASGYFGTIIADITAGAGGVASFNVTSNIPGYDFIEIYFNGRTDEGADGSWMKLEFNGDTTAGNYRRTDTYFYGGAASTSESDAQEFGTIPGANATAGYVGSLKATIFAPDNTLFHKSVLGTGLHRLAGNSTRLEMISISLEWENTGAITAIKYSPGNSCNFVEGSRFIMVGYKNH